MALAILIIKCILAYLVLADSDNDYVELVAERPVIKFTNRKYVANVSMKAFKEGRQGPQYLDIRAETFHSWTDNVTVVISFYELLSNDYKPSFIVFNIKFCSLIEKDVMIGAILKQGFSRYGKCPFPPGKYEVLKMPINVAHIPAGFPFNRGRIVFEAVKTEERVESMVKGFIDFSLKRHKKKVQVTTPSSRIETTNSTNVTLKIKV